jgi:hypothetical protein
VALLMFMLAELCRHGLPSRTALAAFLPPCWWRSGSSEWWMKTDPTATNRQPYILLK